jgi:uncharacterized protein YkwD
VAALLPAAAAAPPKGPRVPDLSRVADLVIGRTNEFRRGEGRGEAVLNDKLAAAARDLAGFMARTGKFGHAVDGKQPWDRAQSRGFDYCLVAENIAYHHDSRGFDTADLASKVFKGWKDSPGHRKNMLQPVVTQTGVALARSEKNGYFYAVQVFGLPRSACTR